MGLISFIACFHNIGVNSLITPRHVCFERVSALINTQLVCLVLTSIPCLIALYAGYISLLSKDILLLCIFVFYNPL